MDEKRIGEIVLKVFEKAKREHASHSRFALSNHISDQSDLSSKTLERAYDRYFGKKKKHGPPNAESIDMFCKYLEYEDYGDYIVNNPIEEPPERERAKWKLIITIIVAFGAVLSIIWVLRNPVFPDDDDSPSNTENLNDSKKKNLDNQLIDKNCMTWADSVFVTISCDTGPFSKYGTKVEPLDRKRLRNMRKVEVNAAYKFFSEEGKPLIWYYKNATNEHEFFTAPGLHPVTDETLRKITEHIIEKYVPKHIDRKSSFLE